MDRRRRRYVPGSEGLEGRQLLSAVEVVAATAPPSAEVVSTHEVSTAAQVAVDSNASQDSQAAQQAPPRRNPGQGNRPLTEAQEQATQQAYEEVIEMRLQRIERLPNFLQLLDPNRALPEEAVAAIQDELRGLVGQLRPPAQPIAEGFIDQLRDAIAQSSLKPQTVASMNFATNRLLNSAGAPEQSINVITEGLTELARTASGSNRPVPVMTNDYALVVQTALGVGRPVTRAEMLGFQSPFAPIAPQTAGLRGPVSPVGGTPGTGMF